MSRIGKKPITVPSGVTASIDETAVTVKGPKGELTANLLDEVVAKLNDNCIDVMPRDDSKQARSMWGLQRSMINNLVLGVTEGFSKELELRGTGYRAQLQGKNLKLQVGFSHEVIYKPPYGVEVACPSQTEITVSGIDKQKVGQAAAVIRSFRPPEPYKGKGIRYKNEYVLIKEGKKK
jgi:large subunit ribosomal protein L6